MSDLVNLQIAARLEETARLLRDQGADPFRVAAYLRAAESVRRCSEPVNRVLRERGIEGLEELHGIGPSIGRAIRDLVTLGRLPMLDRLRGDSHPVRLLASVPGIGRTLAERLHDELGIETLEALEAAAHDGRLADVAGFGEKRLAGIRDSLAHRLSRVRVPSPRSGVTDQGSASEVPSVAELLDVDREYRRKAAAGELRLIAPRRFNPSGEVWLPVLHTQRGARRYTALFSNTARAHRLGKTRNWVVLYSDDGVEERQHTVITAGRGPLRGHRVVAGRERECAALETSTAA